MPAFTKENFPEIFKAFEDVPNLPFILSVIQEEFNDIFDLEALETYISKYGLGNFGIHSLFSDCIKKVSSSNNSFYDKESITKVLANTLFQTLPEFSRSNLLTINTQGNEQQLGFAEKFNCQTLTPDNITPYALDTIDMIRTCEARAIRGEKSGSDDKVVALDHIMHIESLKNFFSGNNPKALFIRCRPKAPSTPPQWITLYREYGSLKIYSESPISELDKEKLNEYLNAENKYSTYEGGKAALSPSSGMRALTKWNEILPIGAFSIEADYPSLLVEWVWLTSNLKSHTRLTWEHFKQSMTQKSSDGRFKLLDVCQREKPSEEEMNYNQHIQQRSYNLGLDWLLAADGINCLITNKKEGTVSFTLKEGGIQYTQRQKSNGEYTDRLELGGVDLNDRFHWSYRRKAQTDFGLKYLLERTPDGEKTVENAVAGMVLHVFRACAKQKTLDIEIPHKFKLDADELNLIKVLMEQNPFVCELKDHGHSSLLLLNQSLGHIFARNRWLQINQYLPPLIGDFWSEAASFWVAHLKNNSSTLMSEDKSQQEFRRCVGDMGIHGLREVLKYLNNNQVNLKYDFAPLLNRVDTRPAFYAACPSEQMSNYASALKTHLENNRYFPFTEFNLSFVPRANENILKIFEALNKKNSFKQLSLVSCLSPENFSDLSALLKMILERVKQDESWTCPICIPELEQASQDPEVQALRIQYQEINNALVKRQRQKNVNALVEREPALLINLEEKSASVTEPNHKTSGAGSQGPKISQTDEFEKQLNTFSTIPLKRTGGLTLQMQQQQQIQQQRSQSYDLENEKGTAYEAVLPAQLVTFDNIDKILRDYYTSLNAEKTIDGTKANGSEEQPILQRFFQTWINANPGTDAKHIINKMTLDAARMLLKHHRQLSGGLNPYNLPKGFFTQKDAQGKLVLGYKPTLQYTTDSNPLTLKLMAETPKPEACLGNYRQFFDDEDGMKLFSQLQPTPADIDTAYTKFIEQNKLNFSEEQKKIIKANWHLFNTFFSEYGKQNIEQFFSLELLTTQQIKQKLGELLDSPLKELSQEFDNIQAMGQILFKYGKRGLDIFMTQLHNLGRIGENFLSHFNGVYLSKCKTFTPLLEKDSLDAFTKMKIFFDTNPKAIGLWKVFLERHMEAVDMDDFAQMWKGFNYFYQRLQDLGVHELITPEILKQIQPQNQNMFTCFERILLCLDKIPQPDQQAHFLKNLAQIDLTEGGAPYAIRHEGFVIFDKDLNLTNFEQGSPTYRPDISKLYEQDFSPLSMHRTLASQGHINAQAYQEIKQNLINGDLGESKRNLLLALHFRFDDVAQLISCLKDPKNIQALRAISSKLFDVFYKKKHASACYPLNLLETIVEDYNQNTAQWEALLVKFDNLWLFDCLQLFSAYGKLDKTTINRIKALYKNANANENENPHPHLREGLMLASIFQANEEQLNVFLQKTKSLKANVRQELQILSNQLLSLDLNQTPGEINWAEIWKEISDAISKMNAHPFNCEKFRQKLMTSLANKGLKFKSSLAGGYCTLDEQEVSTNPELKSFREHESRLQQFFVNHLAKLESKSTTDALRPILNFFKRLQLNKTYINEIEPLLTSLEKSVQDRNYWTTEFFEQLLQALEPKEGQGAFPIAILEAIISEESSPFRPRNFSSLVSEFPKELASEIQDIMAKSGTFNRDQQIALVKLTLRAKSAGENMTQVIDTLSTPIYAPLRGAILEFLLKADSAQIETQFDICKRLVTSIPSNTDSSSQTCQLWFEALNKKPQENTKLLTTILNAAGISDDQRASILNIVAWASIPSSQLISATTIDHMDEGTRRVSKAQKLTERLLKLSEKELIELAKIYPSKPAPDAKQLLSMIKKGSQEKPLMERVTEFQRDSSSTHKKDYATVSLAREKDFQRMLKDTRIITGDKESALEFKDSLRLTMMFKYLKQLEDGTSMLPDLGKPIKQMSQQELKDAFYRLSKAGEQNDILSIQIWAILFEVIGRTTGKYPHLAQQFSLIANEIKLSEVQSSILQLKTGEGKSHFVALRAARHVGRGDKVDVCTAKWSLAERDLLDYKPFFNYLNIKTANIQSSTNDKTIYEEAQVVYTTPGDFSLFLDNQAYRGTPVVFGDKKPVCLGDEFDFLFYEGQKIQYNYAQHTGISPKEMKWFYQALNNFYDNNKEGLTQGISKELLRQCHQHLKKCANGNDDKLSYLTSIDPRNLAAWLQSTHEAASMEMGTNYTVRLEQVKIGDEVLPLQEIYPLTKDMQAAVGSTFSHGVHQLLAERLNQQARMENQPQNFHVHPESHIVSSQVFSQRLKEVWSKWEGFTGTVSATQAQQLNAGYQTQVLRVPTNQKDLRKWPEPQFFEVEDVQLKAIAEKIKQAIREKKSILWCCESDKKVNEMQGKIKKIFTPDEWNNHFMVFTNESGKTAAEVFRDKKDKEGLSLGQKKQGVVLMAAAFGRGDNVDVEMLILQSVHDENDLGQKGGRTARNGEEGEVQQFYMKTEIEKEFWALIDQSSSYDSNIVEQIKSDKRVENLHTLKVADKFKLILRLREFMQSVDNQASVYYHESKAKISSEVIKRLACITDPVTRDQLARQFSNHLEELEKNWTSIKAESKNTQNSIRELKNYLEQNFISQIRGMLTVGSEELTVEFDDYKPLGFLLKPQEQVPENFAIKTAIQNCLLAVEDFPIDAKVWGELQDALSGLDDRQLNLFYRGIGDIRPLTYSEAGAVYNRVIKNPGKFAQAFQTQEGVDKYPNEDALVRAIPKKYRKKVGGAVEQLEAEVGQDFYSYLRQQGPATIKKTLPLLNYVASMSANEAEKARSYFSNPSLVEQLEALPALCFDLFPAEVTRDQRKRPLALTASTLLEIKKFLDKYLLADDTKYSEEFKKMATGALHQTDKRLRWFELFENILQKVPKEFRPELIKTLGSLMQNFKDEKHYAFLDLLLNKTAELFNNPIQTKGTEVPQERYHDLLKCINNNCPALLKGLEPIDAMLRREGKASFFHTENMLKILTPSVISTYQEVLTRLAQLKSHLTKDDEIEHFSNIFAQLKKFSEVEHTPIVIDQMKALKAPQLITALDKYCNSELFSKAIFFEYLISYPAILDYADDVETHLNFLKRYKIDDLQESLKFLTDYIKAGNNFNRFTKLMNLDLTDQFKFEQLWQQPERMKKILALGEQGYQAFFNTLKNPDDYQKLRKYPEILDTYLDYLSSESFDKDQAHIFAKLLVKICDTCQEEGSVRCYTNFLKTNLINKKDLLKTTLELVDANQAFMLEIATNGLASYILKNGRQAESIKQAINTFYRTRAATLSPQNPNTFDRIWRRMNDSSSNSTLAVPDIFDFTHIDAKKDERITWMKLLHSHSLVTDEKVNPAWKIGENGDYYTRNLGKYQAAIDSAFTPNESLAQIKPLDVSKLYHIPDELAQIASVQKPSDAPTSKEKLRVELMNVLSHYKKAWFKNAERRGKVIELEDMLNKCDFSSNNYTGLINQISRLKEEIRAMDTQTNISGFLRFVKPLHSFGRSRLQNALNTMQDTIFKAWINDPSSVQEIKVSDLTEDIISSKLKGFVKALNEWEVKYGDLNQKGSTFLKHIFLRAKTAKVIEEFKSELSKVQGPRDKIEKMQELEDSGKINQLPGELKILALEILEYGKDIKMKPKT